MSSSLGNPQVMNRTQSTLQRPAERRGAADVGIYWDGQLRTRHTPKGRLFREGEINSMELGASGNGPAMTLDEVVVLDRTLNADEILGYMTAVKALVQVEFPAEQIREQRPQPLLMR